MKVIRIDNPKKGIAYTLQVSVREPMEKYFEDLKKRRKEEENKLRYIK